MKLYITIFITAVFIVLSILKLAKASEIIIVTNDKKLSSIKVQQLRYLFALKPHYSWDNETVMSVVYLPFTSNTHKSFVKDVLDVEPNYFRNVVNARIDSTDITWKSVSSFPEWIKMINELDNSIGYISSKVDVPDHLIKIHISDFYFRHNDFDKGLKGSNK